MYFPSENILLEEWKAAVLPHFPALQNKRPLFRLIDSQRLLGNWTGLQENTICLNRALLRQPWYVLVDVLRHEIAHQLTDLLHPLRQEGPHGPLFREICKTIGADPRACAEETSLRDRLFVQEENLDDSITERIRKLLTLADAATNNEAEVALCKAHELMAKHGIQQDQLTEQTYVTISLEPAMGRISTYWKLLAALLIRFWPIEGIWGFVPARTAGKSEHAFFISGTAENVRLASYVWDFIRNRIDYEFTMRFASRGMFRKDHHSFALGVTEGLYHALEKQTASAQETGLILQKDSALRNYFNSRFPSVSHTRIKTSMVMTGAYSQGKDVGENMSISPGLPQKDRKMLQS